MRKTTSTNTINSQNLNESCGTANALSLIGGRWKLTIIWRLANGKMRYGALRDSIPLISERMLVQQLRELERDGLVTRIVYPQVPPRVEYEVTENSLELIPIIQSLSEWGEKQLVNL
jgi:DNA-binding HxlR family transcriptional regulator